MLVIQNASRVELDYHGQLLLIGVPDEGVELFRDLTTVFTRMWIRLD